MAQHRLQYLLSIQSILDLIIMIPVFIIVNADYKSTTFFLISFSRYIRSINFTIILSKYYKLGQTDVDRQINIVFMTMVLMAYIASGMYGVVENS